MISHVCVNGMYGRLHLPCSPRLRLVLLEVQYRRNLSLRSSDAKKNKINK